MDKTKFLQMIKDQQELMQDDLICILDGLDDDVINNVCQVIVDRMEILVKHLEQEESPNV